MRVGSVAVLLMAPGTGLLALRMAAVGPAARLIGVMVGSPAGPVARIISAKSARDSRGTLASLACGKGARGFCGMLVGERGAPGICVSTGCELRPVEREIEVDLFRSFGLFIEDDRERSPGWRTSSLLLLTTDTD